MSKIVTRFAPSPTGRLHVGHAWSALLAYDFARSQGGVFRLRIEDIDGARSKPEHIAGIIEDLQWLGVEWDGDVIKQSDRLARYDAALEHLRQQQLLYPCFCTRAEVAAEIAASGSAPHGPGSDGPAYPGTCRRQAAGRRAERLAAGDAHCWRIDMAAALATPLAQELAAEVREGAMIAGDVVLARKDAPTSYHLAATLDDAEMGVTDVIRGIDLKPATDIHRVLQALLSLPVPRYHYHGLLVDAAGKRIAKRTGGSTLAELREQGADPAILSMHLRAGRFPLGISVANE